MAFESRLEYVPLLQVQRAIFRSAYIQSHGPARTLREMLAQESFAMRNAESTRPTLDSDDLAYTRIVIAPYLDSSDREIVIPALDSR